VVEYIGARKKITQTNVFLCPREVRPFGGGEKKPRILRLDQLQATIGEVRGRSAIIKKGGGSWANRCCWGGWGRDHWGGGGGGGVWGGLICWFWGGLFYK